MPQRTHQTSPLSDIRLFHDLNPTTMELLEAATEVRSLAAGDTVFREGEPGDGVYAVCDGSILLTVLFNEAHRKTLTQVGSGEIFGEMSVLDGQPRSATAVAETDSRVCFIPKQDLLHAVHQSPGLAISLVQEISQRLRRFTQRHVEEALKAERMNMLGICARSIVHDFRNPLSTIGLAAVLAANESTSPEKRRFAFQQIEKQVARLNGMTSELLEFTRDERNKQRLIPTDWPSYIEELANDLRDELAAKDVVLEVRPLPSPVQICIDRQRISHVFYNLFDNAATAMPQGGRILLEFSEQDDKLVTRVRDSGTGISEKVIKQLFEPFVSYGKAQGTGLGLAICKKIIEDHRGTLSASNTPQGGAVFSFTLPLL